MIKGCSFFVFYLKEGLKLSKEAKGPSLCFKRIETAEKLVFGARQ